MSNPFMDMDDLDEDFVPDAEVLKEQEKSKQEDGDSVIVTKSQKPIPAPAAKEEPPSMMEMLSSKLVMIQGQEAKVARIQDVHNAIIAKESIDRIQAEVIATECEDFLTSRLRITEFTQIPSKFNYDHSKNFLSKKISTESAVLTEMIKSFATEDMEQISYPQLMTNMSVTADLAKASSKGYFVEHEKEMIDIVPLNVDKARELLENTSIEGNLKQSWCVLFEAIVDEKLSSFIAARLGQADFVGAVSIAVHNRGKAELTIMDVFQYFQNHYAGDIEHFKENHAAHEESLKSLKQKLVDTLDNSKSAIEYAKDIVANIRTVQVGQQITVSMAVAVAVINKIIEKAGY